MKLSVKSPKTNGNGTISQGISKPYIIIGLMMLVLILSVYLLYTQYSTFRQLQDEFEIEKLVLGATQTKLDILLEHQANESYYLSRISEIDAIAPPELNEARVKHYISGLLDGYDIANKNIGSGSIFRTNGLTGLQIFISGDGNYQNVRNLVRALTNGTTVFRINSIDINRISGGSNSLRFTIDAITFTTEGLATRGNAPAWATPPENGGSYETNSGGAGIENIIKGRINEGDYHSADLNFITINEDLGYDGQETRYIALVYFDFTIKNTRNTANDVMRLYSDDLVATLANKGVQNVSEAAVFWKDDYNNRSLKYAYVFINGGFHINDIAGE